MLNLSLVKIVAQKGDAADFFQGTDVGILQAVREVPVILVRVPCSGHCSSC